MSMQFERAKAALSRVDAMRSDLNQSGPTLRIGLLGRGIGASLTPIMHEKEGERLGLAYRYDLIDFDALDLPDSALAEVLSAMKAKGYRGCNVTFPFKQAIVPLLDGLSSEARAIGAVNTVVFEAGASHGYNTDCSGFAQSFTASFGTQDLGRVIQLGAGGAGSAVAQALIGLGVSALDIVDVDVEKARALAEQMEKANGARVRAILPDQLRSAIVGAGGAVNTTPVGMDKLPGMPLAPDLLCAEQFIVDIIYFPRETELIKTARAKGCRVLSGGGMAIYQAVGAFTLFAGQAADPQEMAKTFARFA